MARSVFWADPSKLRDLVDEVSSDAKGPSGEPEDSGKPWRSDSEPAPSDGDAGPDAGSDPDPAPAPKVDWARVRATAQGTEGAAAAPAQSGQDPPGPAATEQPEPPDSAVDHPEVPEVDGPVDADRRLEENRDASVLGSEPDGENPAPTGDSDAGALEDESPAAPAAMTAGDIGGRLDLVIGMAQERCDAERVFVADSSGLAMRTSGHEDADFVASAALASRYFEQMRSLLQVEGALAGDLILADGRHVILIESDTPAGSIFLGFESPSAPKLQWVQQLQRSLRYALVEWGQRDDG